ncbi:MAG: hypothetical protein GC189_02300 [Alphaproteobacteria bacterium]|nr:hypothetical protein [Alphaproteobacteria bacterium]
MWGSIAAQLREARSAIVGWSLAVATAIVGVVWLSVAAARALEPHLPPGAAATVVGLALLAPLLCALVAAQFGNKRHDPPALQGLAGGAQEPQLAAISRAAERLVEKSPLTALAIAALAGLLAVRFPAALTLLIQILQRDGVDEA